MRLPGPPAALAASLLVVLTAASMRPPACRVQVGDLPPRSCGYIQHSDACCVEPLSTRPVASRQRHLAAGGAEQPHSNVTFGAVGGDGLYLLSHDAACGPAHECWEVSLGPLGALESAPTSPAPDAVVLVSFLAGPKPYNVSLTTVTVPRAAADAALPLGHTADDCRLLRGSTPVLDITGQDASLRLVPPRGGVRGGPAVAAAPPASPALPPVCVTLHSDQCRVDCLNFTVPSQCALGSKYHQSVHCVDKPFDSVLVIRNVTRFQPSALTGAFASPAQGAPQGARSPARGQGSAEATLLFHCARLVLGGCVVATPTVAVRLIPPSVPMDVALKAHWIVKPHTAVLIALPLLLGVLVVFVFHRVWAGPAGPAGPAGAGLRRKVARLRGLEGGLPGGPPAAPPGGAVASETLGAQPAAAHRAQPRRALLLYNRPDDASLRPLLGAVRALTKILEASANVQVVDMYDDPLVLEEGAVLRAAAVVEDESLAVVVLATRCLALRPSPFDLDPHNAFIATVALGLSHVPDRAARRVHTVSLDPRHCPSFLLGIPVAAVYVLPYHLQDLVAVAAGGAPDELALKQFQPEELKLRKCLKEYTLLLTDSPAIAQV